MIEIQNLSTHGEPSSMTLNRGDELLVTVANPGERVQLSAAIQELARIAGCKATIVARESFSGSVTIGGVTSERGDEDASSS